MIQVSPCRYLEEEDIDDNLHSQSRYLFDPSLCVSCLLNLYTSLKIYTVS